MGSAGSTLLEMNPIYQIVKAASKKPSQPATITIPTSVAQDLYKKYQAALKAAPKPAPKPSAAKPSTTTSMSNSLTNSSSSVVTSSNKSDNMLAQAKQLDTIYFVIGGIAILVIILAKKKE